MKIAFSTLSCPNYSWEEIFSMAKDFGFDGIEIREIKDEELKSPFNMENCEKTAARIKQLGIEIPCLATGSCLKFTEKREENIKEIEKYIRVASVIGAKYIRILADLEPAPAGEVDDKAVAEEISSLVPMAEKMGVCMLVETNGVYADTKRLSNLLNEIASDNVGALWDVHHPYRFFGEAPEQTLQNLGAYIKHVHVKDSTVEDGKVLYKMMGEGDVPIDEVMFSLRSINYEGYITLEWVKRWMPSLSDAGIVIPHFINYMKTYLESDTSRGVLFDNMAKTGKYVWEKYSLIDLTFPQVLDRMVEEFPNQYAFRFTTLDYTRTYSEFRDDVDDFARALISMGVKRGDKVAIWATNLPEWYITFWATTKIGAILVTVNTAYKIYEAEYLLRQSDTHTLVMCDGYKDSNYIEIITKLCPELATHEKGKPLYSKRLPFLRNVVTIESENPGCLTF